MIVAYALPTGRDVAALAIGGRLDVVDRLARREVVIVTVAAPGRQRSEVAAGMTRLARERLVCAVQRKSSGQMVEIPKVLLRFRNTAIPDGEHDNDQPKKWKEAPRAKLRRMTGMSHLPSPALSPASDHPQRTAIPCGDDQHNGDNKI